MYKSENFATHDFEDPEVLKKRKDFAPIFIEAVIRHAASRFLW
jgi:hypothetical protein